jgi:hypothetical protein
MSKHDGDADARAADVDLAALVLARANAAKLGGPVAHATAAGLCVHALMLPAEAAGLTALTTSLTVSSSGPPPDPSRPWPARAGG